MDLQTAPVEFHQLFSHRQANAQAAVDAGGGAIPLLKGLKDAIHLIGGDANAGVGDGDRQHIPRLGNEPGAGFQGDRVGRYGDTGGRWP